MGSSGMKRKGRQHLPKVGTRPEVEHDVKEHRERALHPFASDPSRRRGTGAATLIAVVVAIMAVFGVIALVILT
jgi:hypothetical protein